MHFQVQTSDINQGMGMVVRALSARPPRPFYEGVFIETIDEGIQLTCSDGQMTIRSTVPATVVEDGCALMPAKLLHELLRKLDGQIDINVDVSKLKAVITANGSNTDMVCMNAADFPEISEVKGGFEVRLPQNKFASAVSRITFALSTDETRRILTGCLMEVYREEICFVCLDGFRLGMQKVYVSHELPEGRENMSAVIPGAIVGELSRMAGDTDEEMLITFSNTHLCAEMGQTRVYSPLIAGEYINYRQILPVTWTTAVKLDRSQLIGAIDRAALIAREGNNLLKIHVDDRQLTIMANTERGNATENVDVMFDGAPLDIAFNAKYLLDVIRNIDSSEMTMRFNTNVSPCVICPVSGNQYTYLVLPVRTIG